MERVKNQLTILSTCYNHAPYIEEWAKSIWENDYKNIEIVVIDDGSTDNSVEILNKLKEISPCPMTIITQENTGNIGLNLNRGLAKAKGEFVSFFSCDDKYLNDAFSKKMDLLIKDTKLAFVISKQMYELKENGKLSLKIQPGINFDSDIAIEEFCEREYKSGTFFLQANVFRREIIDAIGHCDEDIAGDDIIIRTKVLQYIQRNKQWTFKIIDSPGFIYRVLNSSITKNKLFHVKMFLDCYDRYWAEKPYPEFIQNYISSIILEKSYKEYMPLFSKYPRVMNLLFENEAITKCLWVSLEKSFKKKNIFSFLYRKEKLSYNRDLYVFFNCIKIRKTKKS